MTTAGDEAPGSPAVHHYEPHGLWGPLEERMEEGVHEPVFQRDPAYIRSVRPWMERAVSYFDPEVRGFERLPDRGPFLIVGNHSGGMYMPDVWLFLITWWNRRGPEAEVYSLAFDFVFSIPGLRTLARKSGSIPASHENARGAVERGAPVLVYPGGDHEAFRPWSDRHRIDLHGHKGFVRLALQTGVPVVPMVSHGSHETIIVLSRGERLARLLGWNDLRIHIFPVLLGLPWGVATVYMPTIPLPAKITLQVCEPFDWTGFGPDGAEDEEVVEHCYEQVLGRMQATLDELVEENPHPLLGRLGLR